MMIALKNSCVNFKKLFKYKKRNEVPLPKTSIKGKVQQMKKITYYNTDLEKYVEIEVPININIVTESERFDTQKMLAIGYEKSKIKNKEEQEQEEQGQEENKTISNIYDSYLDSDIEEREEEENKTISNIYDSYLDSVIYATHSIICDVLDNCLENNV